MPWTDRKLVVDSRFLLALYGIMPVSLLVAAADWLFFGGRLRAFLPRQPEEYLWFLFIFNLPHIMASLVTYADAEYLAAYKKPLLKGLAISIAAPAVIAALLGVNALFIFIAFYTLYHVLMQQYGISLMLMGRKPGFAFQAWRWLSIAAGCLLYLNVYRPNAFAGFTGLSMQAMGMALTLAALPFGLWFFAGVARDKAVSRTSKAYYLATFLILPVACLECVWGYPFLLVLVPRFIHDATAFTVYVVHDHNRNLGQSHNFIYRVFKPLHLSPVILCLPLAIALAWGLTAHQYDSYIVMGILVVVMLLHYYLEGWMWRRTMPHRQNVSFRIA